MSNNVHNLGILYNTKYKNKQEIRRSVYIAQTYKIAYNKLVKYETYDINLLIYLTRTNMYILIYLY